MVGVWVGSCGTQEQATVVCDGVTSSATLRIATGAGVELKPQPELPVLGWLQGNEVTFNGATATLKGGTGCGGDNLQTLMAKRYACEPGSNCCGNAVPEAGEACDDGNGTNQDLCTSTCKVCDPPVTALTAGAGALGDAGSHASWALGAQASVEFWVRFNEKTAVTAGDVAVSTAYDDSTTGGWLCQANPEQLLFKLRYADASTHLASPIALTDLAWHHVACDYDGAMMRAFVDGKLVATKAATGTVDSYSQHLLFLHRNKFNSNAVKKYAVREVRVGNLAVHHANFTPRWNLEVLAGTVALWRVADGAGATSLKNAYAQGPSIALQGVTSWVAYGSECSL